MKESYFSLNDNKNIITSVDKTVLLNARTALTGLASFGYAKNDKARLPMIGHTHKDKFEFIIIARGAQQYFIEDKSYTLYPFEGICTAPNANHNCGESMGNNTETIWFQIDSKSDSPLFDLSKRESDILLSQLDSYTGRKIFLNEQTVNCFTKAFSLLKEGSIQSVIKGKALFIYALFCTLDSKVEDRLSSPEIEAAKKYIFLHIKEKIAVSELLEASGLDVSVFKERFFRYTGEDYKEYIQNVKIKAAKEELLKGRSVGNLAFEYGFSSVGSFNKAFKKYFSVSPKRYYAKNKNNDII